MQVPGQVSSRESGFVCLRFLDWPAGRLTDSCFRRGLPWLGFWGSPASGPSLEEASSSSAFIAFVLWSLQKG